MRIYPPHQDQIPGKKAHCRDIPDDQVQEWLDRGWVMSKAESYGIKEASDGVQQEAEGQEEVELSRKRGRKPRVTDGNGA